MTVQLPADATASRNARQLLGEICEQWAIGERLRGELELPVGELVANASLHGESPIRLIVSVASGWFEVAVRDHSADRPVQRPQRIDLLHDLQRVPDEPLPLGPYDPAWEVGPSGSVIAGRGLQIVAATTDTWGFSEFIGGKDVWFRVRIPRDWQPHQPCPCATGRRTTPGGLAVNPILPFV